MKDEFKSQHVGLLNKLSDMSQAPYYALAAHTLITAEMLILQQERGIEKLKTELAAQAPQTQENDEPLSKHEEFSMRSLAEKFGFAPPAQRKATQHPCADGRCDYAYAVGMEKEHCRAGHCEYDLYATSQPPVVALAEQEQSTIDLIICPVCNEVPLTECLECHACGAQVASSAQMRNNVSLQKLHALTAQLAAMTKERDKWKQMAEFQYALQRYPNELDLGQGALDAYMRGWNYETAIAATKGENK